MGFVDRVNNWILRHLGQKTSSGNILITPDALLIRSNEGRDIRILWNDISRITVLTKDAYIPTDFRIMLIEWVGNIIEINEDMKGWDTLPEALDGYLTDAVRSEQWLLALLSPSSLPLTVYERMRSSPNTASPAS